MKKRLLFAVLFSVAAGGMLYQMSWSQENPPVDAPGQEIFFDPPVDPTTIARPPVPAPGQEVEPPEDLEGICIQFPSDIRCLQTVDVPPPVEAPGEVLIP